MQYNVLFDIIYTYKINVQELFLPYLTIEASLFIGVATSG